jgi:2-polyprenyl-3-methyl-5-hydroxy-6-metoxy-1,4-benzoquinol methylase
MDVVHTAAGDRWRQMQDAARGQAQRLADPEWSAPADPYAGRVDSFRAGQRTDQNVVDFLAAANGHDAHVLEVGAGAGRLCVPLARAVRQVTALEPSQTMAEALETDAVAADVHNVRVVPSRWQDYASDSGTDAVYAAHLVYALPNIEEFVQRIERFAEHWCGIILYAEAPQSHLAGFWPAVYGEARLPNPCLPQLLDVLWSLGIYADVKMLQVPAWPLGPAPRAQHGLRRRLRIVPGTQADARLEAAMRDLLTDWGDGALGPLDRNLLELAVAHWQPRI